MKNSYIAVSVNEDDKHCAYVVKVGENDNLLCKMAIKGIEHAHIFDTKKKADETVDFWNDCYRSNGNYMF